MYEQSFSNFFKESILLSEGGNIFSIGRIEKKNVDPTIKSLEKLTGLKLMDNKLGSTGKTETSGDIDLVIKGKPEDKTAFLNFLLSKGIERTSLKPVGIEIAYKAPVIDAAGNPVFVEIPDSLSGTKTKVQQYIQVDFMFHDDPAYLKFYYANNEDAPRRGSHRNITMASIAKAKGYSLSMKGLANRETKEVITRDPKVLATMILGDDATEADLYNIPSIIRYLRKHYSEEEVQAMVGEAETTIGMKVL